MKKQFLILCTSLLLSSSLSFASTAKIELSDNDKENQQNLSIQKKARPFRQSDLDNLFKETIEQAVHTKTTSGNHLSFLFRDDLQESIQKTYNFHQKSLAFLKEEGFFEKFYTLWMQQNLFADKICSTLDMDNLSDLQDDLYAHGHRVLRHKKTGLLLRLKPVKEEQQFSFSIYTKKHHKTLKNGTKEELRALFSSLKCEAEAFKFYLHKESQDNVLAIPVPRDPKSTISLQSFVGEENFKNIPAHLAGSLSKYFKEKLVGTLGHMTYHGLPTYMTIKSSIHPKNIENIDFSSEEAFPSLGGAKVEAKTTPKNSTDNVATTSTSSQDDFDFSGEEYTLTSGTTSTERSSSNDESTKTTTRSDDDFDFSGEEYTPDSSQASLEYSSSNSQNTDMEYNHPVMYPYGHPVPVFVGYDQYGNLITSYVVPLYQAQMAYHPNYHG